jgi:methylglyoxal synthase
MIEAQIRHDPRYGTLVDRHIGLVSSPSLRHGPGSPFARLMRELSPLFAESDAHVYAIEGTMRSIVEYGLLRDVDTQRLHCLPGGHRGGLLDLGAAVVGDPVVALKGTFRDVDGVSKALGLKHNVNCVIYLIDPKDVTSTLAATAALKRECVVGNTPFLATHAAATGWFSLLADRAGLSGQFIAPDLGRRLGWTDFPRRAIALVAHNNKKHEILEFALEHHRFLSGFSQRIGTGTTAMLLNGTFPSTLADELEEAIALCALFEALNTVAPRNVQQRREDLFKLRQLTLKLGNLHGGEDPWVDPLRSGPKGGDLQAGEAILMGLCDAILFFEDPLSPHEHDADIEVFERAARLSNRPERAGHGSHGVMCLHEKESARVWADLHEAGDEGVPVTLAAAFRRAFGVDLVLPAKLPWDGATPWEQVEEEAAWYLVNAIVAGERLQAKRRKHLRVAIVPGGAMRGVIDRIPNVARGAHRRALDLERQLTDQRDRALQCCADDDERELVNDIVRRKWLLESFAGPPLPCPKCNFVAANRAHEPDADAVECDSCGATIPLSEGPEFDPRGIPQAWRCESVTFGPTTGALGSTNPATEANAHARSLSALLGGRDLELAQSTFVVKRRPEQLVIVDPGSSEPAQNPYTPPYVKPDIAEHWQRCDIVVMICDDMTSAHWWGEAGPPMPQRLFTEMEKVAVGEVGGLFVGNGKERFPESDNYDRLA